MRVTLVLQKLAGLRGGAERVVVDLARALTQRGHAVTIVTYEPDLDDPGYEVGDVPVVNLFPSSLRTALRLVRGDRTAEEAESTVAHLGRGAALSRLKWEATHGWFARRLARWLRREEQDVVIGFLPPAISAASLAVERLGDRGPRIIASTHNVPREDFGPDGRWDPNPVARRTNLRALELADAITVLQPEFVEQLPPPVRDRAVVMPNAVERLAPPTGLGRRDLIVGVGRLTDVKRYDVLIRAFARVSVELPGWRLVIHGEGPERGRLEQLVEQLDLADSVTLPGVTSSMGAVYDTARIVGHPARFEGFGLSVAEAILHGAFVVASLHCPGVNRIVDNGTTGLLVDDGDDPVEAFAAGIREVAARSPNEESRSVAASQLAERLAPARVHDAWEALLRG